jgi:hypothetical protein
MFVVLCEPDFPRFSGTVPSNPLLSALQPKKYRYNGLCSDLWLIAEGGMDKTMLRQVAERYAARVDKDETIVLLRFILDRVVGRIRQNLLGAIKENSQATLAKFSHNLQRRLVEMCQVWVSSHGDGVVPVLPDNTKFYTKIANRTAVVIEHKPQVRSLVFSRALLDGCPDRGSLSDSDRLSGMPCAVSLPYIVFTISFVENQFHELRVNYRTQPLRSLNDKLYYTNLPNFSNGDSKCCLGSMYSQEVLATMRSQSVAEQVDRVIQSFYESVFNTDYSDYYKHATQTVPQLKTLRHWIENTRRDPAFMLKVSFKPHTTLKELLNKCVGGTQAIGTIGLSNSISSEIEAALKDVTNQIDSWLAQSVQECLPDHNTVTKALTERLAGLVEQGCFEALSQMKTELERERILLEQERLRVVDLIQKARNLYEQSPWGDEYDSWRKETW